MRPKILIIGLGNPLSGDDGFGARVLARLQEKGGPAIPGVTIIDAQTDLLNHLETFSDYDLIIIIDAVLDLEGKLGPRGSIAVFDEEVIHAWSGHSLSAHQISPLLTVKLFRTLHPHSRSKITLVGLLVDRLCASPCYATPMRILEAAETVRAMIQ